LDLVKTGVVVKNTKVRKISPLSFRLEKSYSILMMMDQAIVVVGFRLLEQCPT